MSGLLGEASGITVNSSAPPGARQTASWPGTRLRRQLQASRTAPSSAMTLRDLATAIDRAKRVLQRRPDMGLHDDSPAVARWQGGTRVVSSHANGTADASDSAADAGWGGRQGTA